VDLAARVARSTTMIILVTVVPVVATLVVLLVLLGYDSSTIGSRQQLVAVHLGRPFPWLMQDQSRFSPPFPLATGLDSPWESPVHVQGWPLLADLLVLWAPLLFATVLAGLGIRGARGLVGRHTAGSSR
jgi:hypothetical protein